MKKQKRVYFFPKTKLGKLSVRLNTFYIIMIIASIILVKVIGILNFDNHWWDVTVPIAFLIEMTALFTGIMSVIKNKEHSILVYFSIVVGLLTILFVPLHSLFIRD